MHRRSFLTLSVAAAAGAAVPLKVRAAVPRPYSFDVWPPMDNAAAYVRWMQEQRGEDPRYLRARFDRFLNMVGNQDVWEARNKRAFLLTPREEFCLPASRAVIYDVNYHDIGFGVTITGPRVVARMTSSVDIKMGEKVLEIGTGSGYQAALLAELAGTVYTIEIVEPLAREAAERLKRLGYGNVATRTGDGYRGWPEHAPFDAIMVTAAPREVPQPLIDQLKPGGRLVVPVGGQAAGQSLLLIEKKPDGRITRRNILAVRFVPLTDKSGRQQ